MSDFNCGDSGVALQFTPQNPIPSAATNISFTFLGVTTQTRISVTATSQNGGVYAQYLSTGTDFTIPDTYNWQLLYIDAGLSLSSVPPHPQIQVTARL